MAVLGVLLLILSITELVYAEEESLLGLQKRCVATATQDGDCHSCICATNGVYHCREVPCNDSTLSTNSMTMQCDPDHIYRQDTTVCTCSSDGYWRSSNCDNHFRHIQPKTNLNPVNIRTNISCKPYHFYSITCNICMCNSNGLINLNSCTNRPCPMKHKMDRCTPGDILKTHNELCSCSDIGYYIDRLCIKSEDDIFHEIKSTDLDKMVNIGRHWDNFETKCTPNTTYQLDCNQCLCDSNGTLSCENAKCDLDVKKVLRSDLKSNVLPELKKRNEKCVPGVKYRYRCNTCVCNNIGEPICTTMICISDLKLSIDALRTLLSNNEKEM